MVFGNFRVIFKKIGHLFVIKLQEGTIDLNVLPAFCYQSVEKQMDSAWDESSIVFILFNTA